MASDMARRSKQRAGFRADRSYSEAAELFNAERHVREKGIVVERTHLSDMLDHLMGKKNGTVPCEEPCKTAPPCVGSLVSEDEVNVGQDRRSIVQKAAVVKQQTQAALSSAMQYYQLAESAKVNRDLHKEKMMKLRCKQAVEAASTLLTKLKQLNALLDKGKAGEMGKSEARRQDLMLGRLFGGIEAIAGGALSPSQWSDYLSSKSHRHVVPTAVRGELKRRIDSSGDGRIEPQELSAYRLQVNSIQDEADMMNWMKARSFDRTEQDLTRQIDLSRTESEARLETVKKEEELLNEKLHIKALKAVNLEAQHKQELDQVNLALGEKQAKTTGEGAVASIKGDVQKAVEDLANVAAKKANPCKKCPSCKPCLIHKMKAKETQSQKKCPPKSKSAVSIKKAIKQMKKAKKATKKKAKQAKKKVKKAQKQAKKATTKQKKNAKAVHKALKVKGKGGKKAIKAIKKAAKKAKKAGKKAKKALKKAKKAADKMTKASHVKAVAMAKIHPKAYAAAQANKLGAKANDDKAKASQQLAVTRGAVETAVNLVASAKKAVKTAIDANEKSRKLVEAAEEDQTKEKKEIKKATKPAPKKK